jgi:hypothetical protein
MNDIGDGDGYVSVTRITGCCRGLRMNIRNHLLGKVSKGYDHE